MYLSSVSYKTYSSSIGRNIQHICIVVKYRNEAFLDSSIRNCCENSFEKTASEYGMQFHAIGFDKDHVHMTVDIGNKLSVADAVRLLKGRSAHDIFTKFPYLKQWHPTEPRFWGGNFWSPAYFFDSVGMNTFENVQDYVHSQPY